jgi:hypothetical protein
MKFREFNLQKDRLSVWRHGVTGRRLREMFVTVHDLTRAAPQVEVRALHERMQSGCPLSSSMSASRLNLRSRELKART